MSKEKFVLAIVFCSTLLFGIVVVFVTTSKLNNFLIKIERSYESQ